MKIGTDIVVKASDKTGNVFGQISNKMTGLQKSIGGFKTRFSDLQKKTKGVREGFTKVGDVSKKVGGVMTAGITAPVVAGLGASVKLFGDFENQMLSVKTLLDKDSFGTTSLSEGFKQMEKDMLSLYKTSPLAMADMTSGLFATVSASIDARNAVSFLGTSGKLAVAGLTDVKTATDGMTSAIKAFGYDASQADLIASKFFTAQKRGKTTIAELSNGLGQVASLASMAGVSFDEVLGSVSASTLAAIKTEQAYTSLKAVFSNIMTPTKDAAEMAEKLGIAFDSTNLRKKGLHGFFKEIMDAAKKEGVPISKVFEKMFGSMEAMNMAAAITGNQYKDFVKITKELKDETKILTTFTNSYGEQANGINNRFIVLTNNLKAVAVAIGDRLKPHVQAITEKLISLFNVFERNPELIKTGLMFAGIAAIVGPLIIIFGMLAGSVAHFITLFNVISSGIGFKALGLIAGKALIVAVAFGTWLYVFHQLITRWDDVASGFELKLIDMKAYALSWANDLKRIANDVGSVFGLKAFDDVKTDMQLKIQAENERLAYIKQMPYGKTETANPVSDVIKQVKNEMKKMSQSEIGDFYKGRDGKLLIDFKNLPKGAVVDTSQAVDKNIGVNYGFQGATQ